MKNHGKQYRASAQKITAETYSLGDAVKLAKDMSFEKFDASLDLHVNLNLDPKQADQQLRTTVILPNGTGKTKKVVAFVGDELIADAKKAGAIEAGNEELFEKINGGWVDFDVAVAHPEMMKEVGKLGKVLGTKGLMPNPKAGTVTPNIVKAIEEIQKGKVEIKADPKGIAHVVCGKMSFEENALIENVESALDAIQKNKPSGAKGTYIESISISSTMGPGIMVSL